MIAPHTTAPVPAKFLSKVTTSSHAQDGRIYQRQTGRRSLEFDHVHGDARGRVDQSTRGDGAGCCVGNSTAERVKGTYIMRSMPFVNVLPRNYQCLVSCADVARARIG